MPIASDAAFQPPKELEEVWNRHPAIVKLGDPILRQVARPVTRLGADMHRLIERMALIMREAHGLGLAAPQVGVSSRILIYDVQNDNGLRVLINPVILSQKGEQQDPLEGCLSIPGLQGRVNRAMEIRVKGFDQRGKPVSLRVSELEARVIQHEIDHLNGILFIDKADPETLEWILDGTDKDEVADASRE